MFRILIAEDEEPIANLIRMNLTKAGYLCTWAPDGKSAADLMEREKYDLALLDIMLPGINGYELMDYAKACELPVIFLTAKGETFDKVLGLELGADDYVTKPFSVKELAARVRAVIRRQEYLAAPDSQTLTVCGISIDASRRHVLKNGEPVELTQREFDLLYTLMKTPGRVYTREMLLDTVWKVDFFGDTRTVDVHVRYLRQKLEDEPDHPKRILTVRGVGYRFAEEES